VLEIAIQNGRLKYILENNVLVNDGETHYNLAYDLVFVGADRIGR
jgi:hypothetical protein